MKAFRSLTLLSISFILLACSFEYIPAPKPTPTLANIFPSMSTLEDEPLFVPSLTPAPATPDFTPAPPTAIPPITRTPTLIVPMLMAPDDNIHCRVGPSLDWDVLGILPRNTWTGILGRSADGDWWYIPAPKLPGQYCFVARAITTTTGNLTKAPVIQPPQALVTGLNVELLPDPAKGDCSNQPYQFQIRVEISVDGPTQVTFQRSMDNGNAEPPETYTLEKSGRYVYSYPYTTSTSGSHWALIELYAPNVRTSKDTAKLTCFTPTPP